MNIISSIALLQSLHVLLSYLQHSLVVQGVTCEIYVVEFDKSVEYSNTKKCDNGTGQHLFFFRGWPHSNAKHAEYHSHSTKEQWCRHFQFRINGNSGVLEYIITLIHTPTLHQGQRLTRTF